jgi:aryl-alcohol dehydrogenase-like predicted oxidoreductase
VLARRLAGLSRPVGAVGLGCVGMSAEYNTSDIDDEQSLRVLARALELGVSLFDTADVYGPFSNERLLGRAFRGRAADAVIATKVGLVQDQASGRESRRADPAHIRASCDASLGRLGVDAIDLYYQHRVDPQVPIEDVAGAVKELIKAGKVKHFGMSEAAAGTIRRAHAVQPVTAIQSEYSSRSDTLYTTRSTRMTVMSVGGLRISTGRHFA